MSARRILPEHRKAIHARTFSEPYSACALERPTPRRSRALAWMAAAGVAVLGLLVVGLALRG